MTELSEKPADYMERFRGICRKIMELNPGQEELPGMILLTIMPWSRRKC